MKVNIYRFKQRIIRPFIISVSIILIFLFSVVLIKSTQLKKVLIYGPQINIVGLDKLSGKNILNFNDTDFKIYLLKYNFLIRNIGIKKTFPDTIVLHIIERKPAAQIINQSFSYQVSDDGVIIAKQTEQESHLPKIYDKASTYKIGEKTNTAVQSVISLTKSLSRQNFEINKINIDNNDQSATIVLTDDTQIAISLTKDLTTLPASLQLIMTRFRIEGKKPSKIDFRFEKPIVTLANGENKSP